MSKPFSNVRVIDFTQFLAGPFATQQLGLMGADVIKIEPLVGDDVRRSALPKSREWTERNLSPGFMANNANKRSLTLDLRKPEAVEVVKRLVATADVVCENYRPGVMDRLGLGYEELSAINPTLIYCGMSGFGRVGPESRTASFDGKIQAMCGLMTMTGDPAGGPMRAGIALADLTTGLNAALAMASALFQRTHTGKGQFIDVAMFDSMLNLMAGHVAEYTVVGHHQQQYGNLSVSRKATADRFKCGDGFLVLAVLTEKQFASLMVTLGHPQAVDDPRFGSWAARTENQAALRHLIESSMAQGSPEAWAHKLTVADVPCSNILTLAEAIEHEQVKHRKVIQTVETPYGPVRLAGSGFEMAHGSSSIDRPPPKLGQHNEELLRELGYADAEIDSLRQAGVTAIPKPEGLSA